MDKKLIFVLAFRKRRNSCCSRLWPTCSVLRSVSRRKTPPWKKSKRVSKHIQWANLFCVIKKERNGYRSKSWLVKYQVCKASLTTTEAPTDRYQPSATDMWALAWNQPLQTADTQGRNRTLRHASQIYLITVKDMLRATIIRPALQLITSTPRPWTKNNYQRHYQLNFPR